MEINKENGFWIVNRRQLSSDKVIFYYFIANPPEKYTELDKIMIARNYSIRYRTFIEPVFK